VSLGGGDIGVAFTDELADAAERAAPKGLLSNQRKPRSTCLSQLA